MTRSAPVFLRERICENYLRFPTFWYGSCNSPTDREIQNFGADHLPLTTGMVIPALRPRNNFVSDVGVPCAGSSCSRPVANTGSLHVADVAFSPLSSFCWKALIALYENGIAFTPNLVDLGNPAERAALQKLWPIGKFPVLRDHARGATVPESSIIIEYLDRHYPGMTRFIPDEPSLRLADAAARPVLRSLCASADAEDHG